MTTIQQIKASEGWYAVYANDSVIMRNFKSDHEEPANPVVFLPLAMWSLYEDANGTPLVVGMVAAPDLLPANQLPGFIGYADPQSSPYHPSWILLWKAYRGTKRLPLVLEEASHG